MGPKVTTVIADGCKKTRAIDSMGSFLKTGRLLSSSSISWMMMKNRGRIVSMRMQEELFLRSRLYAACRTGWACLMVALIMQLGSGAAAAGRRPAVQDRWVTFPIFAYVMAVTVVGESTAGKALRDAAAVLTGAAQAAAMAILVLAGLSLHPPNIGVAIACISATSFLICAQPRTQLLHKRVAMAHTGIIYVTALASHHHGGPSNTTTTTTTTGMDPVLFPLKLAATTLVGALCGTLALLLPPRLALSQVHSHAKLCARVTAERLRVLVDGFCVRDKIRASAYAIRASSLARIASSVHTEINSIESDMGWETRRLPCHGLRSLGHVTKGLTTIRKHLEGMELALQADLASSRSTKNKRVLHRMMKSCLIHLTDWSCLALLHIDIKQRSPSSLNEIQVIVEEGNEVLCSLDEKLSCACQQLDDDDDDDDGDDDEDHVGVDLDDEYESDGENGFDDTPQHYQSISNSHLITGTCGVDENANIFGDSQRGQYGFLHQQLQGHCIPSFNGVQAANFFFLFNLKKVVEEIKYILCKAAVPQDGGSGRAKVRDCSTMEPTADVQRVTELHSDVHQKTSKRARVHPHPDNHQSHHLLPVVDPHIHALSSRHLLPQAGHPYIQYDNYFQGRCDGSPMRAYFTEPRYLQTQVHPAPYPYNAHFQAPLEYTSASERQHESPESLTKTFPVIDHCNPAKKRICERCITKPLAAAAPTAAKRTAVRIIAPLMRPCPEQLMTAFKMCLAMGIGAFLGYWFNNNKGYWADITLALGFTGPAKGGSFKVAVLRTLGTTCGSMYGLLVVLATFQYPVFVRLLALLPWVVFTSFLRQSKIFGYAGAVSAFTGAIVILARTSKDSSDQEFTVIRIVEAFLGMAIFIIVEMLVLPRRAASMVKREVIQGLGEQQEFVTSMLDAYTTERLCHACRKDAIEELKWKEKKLRGAINRQNKLVKEATEEPQFWFAPFPAAIFSKLMEQQGKIMELLHFAVRAFEEMRGVAEAANMPMERLLQAPLKEAMEIVEAKVPPTLGCLAKLMAGQDGEETPNSAATPKTAQDLEAGSNDHTRRLSELDPLMMMHATARTRKTSSSEIDYSAPQAPTRERRFTEAFARGALHVASELATPEAQAHVVSPWPHDPLISPDSLPNSVVLSLGTLAFAFTGLLQRTTQLEKAIHELLQEENPWSLIDYRDTSRSFRHLL